MGAWPREKKILQHVTSPYHHESNSRVEKLNQTLTEGLNKNENKGTLHQRLAQVVEGYNEGYHSSIKMTPIQAQDPARWEELRKRQFDNRIKENKEALRVHQGRTLKVGDKVVIDARPILCNNQ